MALNDDQRFQLKEKIEKAIKRTKRDIEELEELTQPIAPENSLGRITRMDAINNKSVSEASLRQAEDKLSKLEYALKRINDQDLDQCVQCKSEIPYPRLLLIPESNKCVRCAR